MFISHQREPLTRKTLGFLILRWPQATPKPPTGTGSGRFIFRPLTRRDDGEREEGKAGEGRERRLRRGGRKGKENEGWERPGFPSLGERKMTSGKLPRQDKPSLLPRASPGPPRQGLKGHSLLRSTALAVSKDTEALGYLQALAPHAAAACPWRPPPLGQAETARAGLRTKPLTHSACRGTTRSLRTQGPPCGF